MKRKTTFTRSGCKYVVEERTLIYVRSRKSEDVIGLPVCGDWTRFVTARNEVIIRLEWWWVIGWRTLFFSCFIFI
jgi:hypothetical protein